MLVTKRGTVIKKRYKNCEGTYFKTLGFQGTSQQTKRIRKQHGWADFLQNELRESNFMLVNSSLPSLSN